ncbi:F-box associated domain containing protein [Tanacetum coccineum]
MGQFISKPLNTHSQTPNQPQQNVVTFISHFSMEDLPTDVTVDILSRLPVKTIIHCKCVCKKWRILVSEANFVKLHLSRSHASLLFHHFTIQELHNFGQGILKLVDIEDDVHHHHLYHDPRMSFDLNRVSFPKSVEKFRKLPIGSIDGLVCLTESGNNSDNTYICNPITREYMMLPKHYFFSVFDEMSIVCGFGVGLVTEKYKVIRTLLTHFLTNPNPKMSRPDLLEAEVYTLGTGKWRSLGYWLDERKKPFNSGPYLNGHVHWIIRDKDCPEKICTSDFDSEKFKLF